MFERGEWMWSRVSTRLCGFCTCPTEPMSCLDGTVHAPCLEQSVSRCVLSSLRYGYQKAGVDHSGSEPSGCHLRDTNEKLRSRGLNFFKVQYLIQELGPSSVFLVSLSGTSLFLYPHLRYQLLEVGESGPSALQLGASVVASLLASCVILGRIGNLPGPWCLHQ